MKKLGRLGTLGKIEEPTEEEETAAKLRENRKAVGTIQQFVKNRLDENLKYKDAAMEARYNAGRAVLGRLWGKVCLLLFTFALLCSTMSDMWAAFWSNDDNSSNQRLQTPDFIDWRLVKWRAIIRWVGVAQPVLIILLAEKWMISRSSAAKAILVGTTPGRTPSGREFAGAITAAVSFRASSKSSRQSSKKEGGDQGGENLTVSHDNSSSTEGPGLVLRPRTLGGAAGGGTKTSDFGFSESSIGVAVNERRKKRIDEMIESLLHAESNESTVKKISELSKKQYAGLTTKAEYLILEKDFDFYLVSSLCFYFASTILSDSERLIRGVYAITGECWDVTVCDSGKGVCYSLLPLLLVQMSWMATFIRVTVRNLKIIMGFMVVVYAGSGLCAQTAAFTELSQLSYEIFCVTLGQGMILVSSTRVETLSRYLFVMMVENVQEREKLEKRIEVLREERRRREAKKKEEFEKRHRSQILKLQNHEHFVSRVSRLAIGARTSTGDSHQEDGRTTGKDDKRNKSARRDDKASPRDMPPGGDEPPLPGVVAARQDGSRDNSNGSSDESKQKKRKQSKDGDGSKQKKKKGDRNDDRKSESSVSSASTLTRFRGNLVALRVVMRIQSVYRGNKARRMVEELREQEIEEAAIKEAKSKFAFQNNIASTMDFETYADVGAILGMSPKNKRGSYIEAVTAALGRRTVAASAFNMKKRGLHLTYKILKFCKTHCPPTMTDFESSLSRAKIKVINETTYAYLDRRMESQFLDNRFNQIKTALVRTYFLAVGGWIMLSLVDVAGAEGHEARAQYQVAISIRITGRLIWFIFSIICLYILWKDMTRVVEIKLDDRMARALGLQDGEAVLKVALFNSSGQNLVSKKDVEMKLSVGKMATSESGIGGAIDNGPAESIDQIGALSDMNKDYPNEFPGRPAASGLTMDSGSELMQIKSDFQMTSIASSTQVTGGTFPQNNGPTPGGPAGPSATNVFGHSITTVSIPGSDLKSDFNTSIVPGGGTSGGVPKAASNLLGGNSVTENLPALGVCNNGGSDLNLNLGGRSSILNPTVSAQIQFQSKAASGSLLTLPSIEDNTLPAGRGGTTFVQKSVRRTTAVIAKAVNHGSQVVKKGFKKKPTKQENDGELAMNEVVRTVNGIIDRIAFNSVKKRHKIIFNMVTSFLVIILLVEMERMSLFVLSDYQIVGAGKVVSGQWNVLCKTECMCFPMLSISVAMMSYATINFRFAFAFALKMFAIVSFTLVGTALIFQVRSFRRFSIAGWREIFNLSMIAVSFTLAAYRSDILARTHYLLVREQELIAKAEADMDAHDKIVLCAVEGLRDASANDLRTNDGSNLFQEARHAGDMRPLIQEIAKTQKYENISSGRGPHE